MIKIIYKILILFSLSVYLIACNKSKIVESLLMQNVLSVCETPWHQIVAEGAKSIAYEKDYALCTEDCVAVEYLCKVGNLISTKRAGIDIIDASKLIKIENTKSSCTKEINCGCLLPNNKGVISNGVTAPVFSISQVACGQTCDSKKINVLCKNGTFVDPVSLQPTTLFNFSCTPLECKSCIAPWDQALIAAHTGTITGYINNTLLCGLNCSAATNAIKFNCFDGVLTRENGSLLNAANTLKSTCQINTNCTCTSADSVPTIYVNDSIQVLKLFQKPLGTCASPCDAGTDYKCLQDKFTKTADSTVNLLPLYKVCNDQCVYCDLPDGSKIQQDTKATFYKTPTGTCAKSCEKIEVLCNVDSVALKTSHLSIVSGVAPINDYKITSCSETCVSCNLPDGTKLQENLNTTFYSYSIKFIIQEETADPKSTKI